MDPLTDRLLRPQAAARALCWRAMRITIDRCPEGRFELAQACPAADLAGAVVRYAGYVERTAWTLHQREVAAPIVPLIINFGAAVPGPARRRADRRRRLWQLRRRAL